MTALVDTHAHLHDSAFDADRGDVIGRARGAGVARFLTIGTDVPTSAAAVALAAAEPDVYAAVGIHPHDARTANKGALERIAALARAPRVVAIGEIGLDYYRDHSPRPVQRTALVAQLRLARAVASRRRDDQAVASELRVVPGFNELCAALLWPERLPVARRWRLPWGSSLLAVARVAAGAPPSA